MFKISLTRKEMYHLLFSKEFKDLTMSLTLSIRNSAKDVIRRGMLFKSTVTSRRVLKREQKGELNAGESKNVSHGIVMER